MSKAELLYATNNPGKVTEVRTFLGESDIRLLTPKDLEREIEVEETGRTLEENALLKAWAYHRIAPEGSIVMGDDTGLEIEALGGEPGVHVRRWRDGKTRMTDAEVKEYTLERMKDVPPGKRGAQFRTVMALVFPDKGVIHLDGVLRGEIAEEPVDMDIEGFPFRGLFFVPEAGRYLGELEDLPEGQFLTHRQKAAQKVIDYLSHVS